MFNLIVCGSRNFHDYATLCAALDDYLSNFPERSVCLLSGGARGADSLAIRYARERGHACRIFPALWSRFGKAAGPRRNHWMLANADACFAFHDGESLGTAHMLRIARAKGIPSDVYYYENQLAVF